MFKRNIIMLVTMFCLAFCVLSIECFADAAAELEQADAYLEAGEYEQAEGVYKEIAQNYPGSDEALEAQKELGVLYITWEKQPEAKQAFSELLSSFSSNPGITDAVRVVCERYWLSEKYQNAAEFFQHFLDNRPKDDNSIWLQVGLMRTKIAFGNDSAAEALLKEMLSDFGGKDMLLANAFTYIAHGYIYTEQYQKAYQLFSQALDKRPADFYSMWAHAGRGMCNVALGKYSEADAAVEKLINDFSDQPEISEAVLSIADAYFDIAKEYGKAAELFGYISKTWPDSEAAIFSQAGLARTSIALGDNSAALEHIGKLLVDFDDDNRLAGALKLVADSYLEIRDYENANLVYSQALDKGLEDKDAIWAVMGIGMSNAALGNHDEAQTKVEKLLIDFSWHPDVGMTVFNIAEKYYEEALRLRAEELESQASSYSQLALDLMDIVKRDFPEFANKPEVDADIYLYEGACYRHLGDYERAIECYQQLVDKYPEHHVAYHALFMTGRGYEKLKETGKLSESQADAKIKAAYRQLVEDYPDSKPVRIAERWLNRNDSK